MSKPTLQEIKTMSLEQCRAVKLEGLESGLLSALVTRMGEIAVTKPAPKALSLKVSSKGGISLYGMGKWPVTLYREQWERLLSFAPEIQEFIKANSSVLVTKH